MNAPVVMPRDTRKPAFPAAVHTYTDLLRVLADSPVSLTAEELAEATERVTSNVRRDLPKLRDADVIAPIDGGWTITEKGIAWVQGQDVAEGRAPAPQSAAPQAAAPADGVARAPHAAFRANPDNPRKTFDPDVIAGIADTIAEAGDLLQPIVARPRDPADPMDGDDAKPFRMLWAGEQRWRAIGLLIEQGRLPTALDPAKGGGVPFLERKAFLGAASYIALVENGARAGLDPLEEAFAFRDYQDDTGLSARQIAIATGRAPGGEEGKVRTVQTRIKVAREATPEAIEAYWRNRDWKELLATVQEKREPVEQAAEAVRAAREERAFVDVRPSVVWKMPGDSYVPSAGIELGVVDGRWVYSTRHQDNESGHSGPLGLLRRNGGDDGYSSRVEAFAAAVKRLRDRTQIDDDRSKTNATQRRRIHKWLDSLGDGSIDPVREDATPTQAVVEEAADQSAQPQPVLIEPAAPPALQRRAVILLAEIAHKSDHQGEAFGDDETLWAPAGQYWLDTWYSDLKGRGLVMQRHEKGGGPYVALTPAGDAALVEAARAASVDVTGDRGLTDEALQALREANGKAAWEGPGYVTDWLNATLQPAIQAPAAELATVQSDIEDLGDADDEETVESILGVPLAEIVNRLDSEAAPSAAEFLSDLLLRTGIRGPFVASQSGGEEGVIFDASGGGCITVDVNGELSHGQALAQAIVIAAALNAALGLLVDIAPRGEAQS